MVPADHEASTTGDAVPGMLLHGRGFAERPLSLPPPLFATKPVALLLRAGGSADHCTRFTLGRRLDTVASSGCALVCSASALPVCRPAGRARRCTGLATTSVALTGV